MAEAVISLLVNVVIVALLAATVGYCWLLNRRIKVLQDSRSELAQLLKHFDESTTRASESIVALQTASKKIGENIQLRIDKANYLLDDLAFMIEKGEKLADKIEASFAVDRARTRVMAEQDVEAPPAREAASHEKPISNRERTAASLEAVLERVTGRSHAPAKAEEPPAPPPSLRSKSEQALAALLRAGKR